MNENLLKKIKWSARISGSIIFILFLPFYLGYGIPLPNSSMSFIENIWFIIFPLVLIGLIIGWKKEKVAGFLIIIPTILGSLLSLIFWRDPIIIMYIPLIPAILYLIYVYNKK
ncbi:MAG: hypothetical protein PHT94_03870 [Candidatus Nanoarchaeia archaeon]|nr:hypothetical protein [Candidatus Nanoarchaeia archaeon]